MAAPALPPDSLLRRDAHRLTAVALELLPPEDIGREALRVPWDYPEREAAFLRDAVARNEAVALAVSVDGIRCGSAYGRIIRRGASGQIRVFHLLGIFVDTGDTATVWHQIRPMIEAFAARLGCEWIEGETARPAVAASLSASGYLATEVRFAKQLQLPDTHG